MKKAKLLWIDLEMTGLDPKEDRILEVAAIATDMDLNQIATFQAIIRVDDELIKTRMVGKFWEENHESRDALIAQTMFYTPPCVSVFAAVKTLEWIKQNGGVKEMEKRAIAKSTKLYDEIDRNRLFKGTAQADSRSRMNVCFVMNDEYKDLEQKFIDFTKERDMVGLKGHRSVGGFRASLYNALPEASVDALVQAMKDFEKQN